MQGSHDQPIDTLADLPMITRRQFVARVTGVAAALALPGVFAACSRGEKQAEKQDALTNLAWGLPAGVDNISPNNWTTVANVVAKLGLEALLQVSPEGQIEPWLADSFENRGNQEFILTLREGIKWSDGSPLTIDDVLFQYHYILEHPSQPVFIFWDEFGLTSVEKTGPREVTIRAERPNPRIPAIVIASQSGWLVQPAFLKKTGYDRMGSPDTLPIGTGPYVFDEFVPDSSLTVSRNEHYWANDRLGPMPEKITISFFKEESSRVLAARSGQISGTHLIEGNQLDQYESIPEFTTYSIPELSIYFFHLNNRSPPFDDVHSRRAVAYALDKQGIADTVWEGKAEPAATLVPPQTWRSFLSDSELHGLYNSIPTYEYDLDKAAAELAKSKYAGGFTLDTQTTQTQPNQVKICQIFAQDLEEIGIRLNIKEVSDSQYYEPLVKNEVDDPRNIITVNSFPPESPDPSPNLEALLASWNAKPGLANVSHFRNDRVDKLLKRQVSTTERSERARYLAEVIRIAANQVPYLPVVWPQFGAATGPGIKYRGLSPYTLNGQPWPAGLYRS